MAVKLYNDTDIQNIADSIRAKNGSGYTYKVSEMSAAINGLEVLNGETVSITPSTSAQTITPSSGHNGITEVNVAAVTSSIDSNIQAGNIKKDVSILGVTGTLPEKQLGTKTITENGTYKASNDNLDGYSEVEVATSGVDINEYLSNTITKGDPAVGGWIKTIKKLRSPLTIEGTDATCMFYKYPLNELPQIDTSNVTNMDSMFSTCTNLTTIPQLDTSNVTNMNAMFYTCTNLTTIPQLDTSNVTNMGNMFKSCYNLTTIPQLNGEKLTSVAGTFVNCNSLENFNGIINLGQAYLTTQSANYSRYTLDLLDSNNLTHESLMNVINNLYDIKTKGCNVQKLTLGTTNVNKLTSEEIAIATEKGWTVS